MGVRFYDRALLNKLKGWVKDPNATILGPGDLNRTFQIMADKSGDKPVTFPLIILSRDGTVQVTNNSMRPLTYDAHKLLNSEDESKTVQLNAIPITLNYQLDIVTKYYDEADEYIRNFVFNLINYPRVEITVPYNDVNFKHRSSITLDPNITDNSDNPQRLFQGQLNDWSIKFSIDNAYLFSVPFNKTWTISSPIELSVKQDDIQYVTEYVGYKD